MIQNSTPFPQNYTRLFYAQQSERKFFSISNHANDHNNITRRYEFGVGEGETFLMNVTSATFSSWLRRCRRTNERKKKLIVEGIEEKFIFPFSFISFPKSWIFFFLDFHFFLSFYFIVVEHWNMFFCSVLNSFFSFSPRKQSEVIKNIFIFR